MPKSRSKPDRLTRIRIAGGVPCDPRTVDRYFERGKPLTTVALHNIRRVINALGIPDPRAGQV